MRVRGGAHRTELSLHPCHPISGHESSPGAAGSLAAALCGGRALNSAQPLPIQQFQESHLFSSAPCSPHLQNGSSNDNITMASCPTAGQAEMKEPGPSLWCLVCYRHFGCGASRRLSVWTQAPRPQHRSYRAAHISFVLLKEVTKIEGPSLRGAWVRPTCTRKGWGVKNGCTPSHPQAAADSSFTHTCPETLAAVE